MRNIIFIAMVNCTANNMHRGWFLVARATQLRPPAHDSAEDHDQTWRVALSPISTATMATSDVVTLGRQHMRDGVIRFVPQKTKRKKLHGIEIPVAPELAKIIAATPTGDMTFLMTEWGKPFTANGFGNWFHDRWRELAGQAGIPDNVQNRDGRAGAATEADLAGVPREKVRRFHGHGKEGTTAVYQRANRELRTEIAKVRVEKRK